MTTLADISVPSNEFVALSVLTSRAAGTAMELQIKSIYPVVLQVNPTKPANNSISGRVLKDFRTQSGVITIQSGSEEVWLRCLKEGSSATINVEVA